MIEDINKRIKLLGLKKKHIANRIGISPVELSYYLNGTRKMPVDVQTKLINYLNL